MENKRIESVMGLVTAVALATFFAVSALELWTHECRVLSVFQGFMALSAMIFLYSRHFKG